MSKLVTALVCAALAITAACKKDQSATGADAKKAMGLYAQGYNALLDDPSHLIAGYFASPPSGAHSMLSSPTFATSKLKEVRTAFAAARDAAPESLQLGPAADAAVASAEKAVAIYESAYKYYQAETYKDDHGAKGKELDAQLKEASKTFDDAMAKLAQGMDGVEDTQAKDEIAKYADDKGYSYWFRFYTHEAKQVVQALARAHSPAELGKAIAAIKGLAPHNEALAAFVASKANKLPSAFKSYADDATALQAELTKLVRLTDGGKPRDDAEVGSAIDSVISRFNNLIQMNNTLYELEAVDNLKDQ